MKRGKGFRRRDLLSASLFQGAFDLPGLVEQAHLVGLLTMADDSGKKRQAENEYSRRFPQLATRVDRVFPANTVIRRPIGRLHAQQVKEAARHKTRQNTGPVRAPPPFRS